jgi:hypothetical protein
MKSKFEKTRQYADELLKQRELIDRINKPMRNFWHEVGNPDTEIFAKHVWHVYDIELTFDDRTFIDSVKINNEHKLTMFLLKYG